MISLPQLLSSWGRTALVVGGISTGVTLIVAINIINTSVLANFLQTIDLIAGPAALEVTLGVGEVGFDESIAEHVRSDPDVASAVPLVRGTISVADDATDVLQLFGADFVAEEDLARYQVTSTTDRREILRTMADPNAVLLTTEFAGRHGVKVGGRLTVATPTGVRELVVRGLLETRGLAAAFGGQLAVMDLPAAQMLVDKAGRLDQIDVVVRPGASVAEVQRRLQSGLPSTLTVAQPAQRGAQYERILSAFQAMLTGLSALCLLAGVFIIYNTTSTAAIQRANVMGGLRIIGAEGRTLFRLLMLEALVLGVAGSICGLVSGVILARLLTGMVSESMGVIFQLRFPVQSLAINMRDQAFIVGIGVLAALFASYFAARQLSALDSLQLMRGKLKFRGTQMSPYALVAWWVVMVCVSVAALRVQVVQHSFAWGNLGSTLWNASILVIAVPLVHASASLLERMLPRLFGAEGRVAVHSLLRMPTRTGMTVAAVAMVLALSVTVASLLTSFRESVSSYFEEGGLFSADLVVSAMATEGGWLETPLPGELIDRIARVDGVARTEPWRALYGQIYNGERVIVVGLSDGFFDPDRFTAHWYRDGDPVSAAAAMRAGKGVAISTALADREGLHVGDSIELDSPTGKVSMPIVGVVRDYMSDRGAVVISRRLLVERWREATVSRVNTFLAPGASRDEVRTRIVAAVGNAYRLKILTPPEVITYQAAAIDRAFAFMASIQLLIIIVTLAGILDLLLAAITERRRELALWRVIGADENAVRRSVVIESATVGSLGVVLGMVVGVVTAWIWIGINYRYLLGYYLEFHFAVRDLAWYISLIIVMTVCAGYGAARYATRQSILLGIQAD